MLILIGQTVIDSVHSLPSCNIQPQGVDKDSSIHAEISIRMTCNLQAHQPDDASSGQVLRDVLVCCALLQLPMPSGTLDFVRR